MVTAPKVKNQTVPKRSKKWESGKTKKKKKQAIKYYIECKNPVEDGIMNVNDFVRFSIVINMGYCEMDNTVALASSFLMLQFSQKHCNFWGMEEN